MSVNNAVSSLKKLDINELDFSNIGTWPVAAKAIACFIIFIAVGVAGYFLLLQDVLERLDFSKVEEVRLKDEYAVKAVEAGNLEAYKTQLSEMESSFNVMLRQLPSETEVPALLEDISRAAFSSDLELEELQLLPEVATQFYIELPIQTAVVGEYHNIAAFVSAISSLPRIVTLHDFSIRPVSEEEPTRLHMDILAKTYRYDDKKEARP